MIEFEGPVLTPLEQKAILKLIILFQLAFNVSSGCMLCFMKDLYAGTFQKVLPLLLSLNCDLQLEAKWYVDILYCMATWSSAWYNGSLGCFSLFPAVTCRVTEVTSSSRQMPGTGILKLSLVNLQGNLAWDNTSGLKFTIKCAIGWELVMSMCYAIICRRGPS